MSIIHKITGKLKAGAWFPFYNLFYERLKLNPKWILLESRGGNGLEGNILRILEELQKEPYQRKRCILSVRKNAVTAVDEKLAAYGIRRVHRVKTGSIRYYYYLAKAGYLVNDTSFPGRFVKKENQVYLNTWHGTPLKKMGKDNRQEMYGMGNVMRNLIQSDYLIFPNSYMEEKMSAAYMLPGLFRGKVLEEGYPRNSVFYDGELRDRMRKILRVEDMQLIVYMPTFRGNVEAMEETRQCEQLAVLLRELDEGLNDNQLLYVKLHPLMHKGIDVSGFSHIAIVPSGCDIYDVLQASDVLVTDYSSIFYDYANTDRKIILFTYDEAEYSGSRGIYEDVNSYPFPKAVSVKELLEKLKESGIEDREEFRKRYCTYDNSEAAENICRHIFLGQQVCKYHFIKGNGRENVLIYAGDLDKNGITTALLSMLAGLDKEKYNYYLSFRKSSLEKAPERLERIPADCGVIPIASEMNMDLPSMLAQMLYLRRGLKSFGIGKRLDKAYRREWKKHFGRIEFAHVIHYNGYERYVIALIQRYSGTRTIWVHNDMLGEIEKKGNQNIHQLRDAYREYDHVVVVSPDIYDATVRISHREDNITVIGNCHNYREVLRRGNEPLRFDEGTLATVELGKLQDILNKPVTKFISIGRFSVEKGHKRLIQAFERYWKEHSDTYLIIIGGTGNLYEETLKWAKECEAADNVILIRSMSNPMPVLKQCQLFILSSVYEGLGLVMLEADTLGVPVIACDVNGPRGFLKEHGGTLVTDSEEGIYEGMKLYAAGKVRCMNVDYEKLNQANISKCEQLI